MQSRSSGGTSAALHGCSWLHPLSAGWLTLPCFKAHKGIPGAADLYNDPLDEQQLHPEPARDVLDLVSQVHDVVLMYVYLDLRNPGGSGFWNEGI
jgi:hypothetical protein